MSGQRDRRWNHNTHYHDVVLRAAPPMSRTALDVGTGDGLLANRLSDCIAEVTAIDSDEDVIARARGGAADVTWIVGDVMTHPLRLAYYDVVAAVASVHHLADLSAGLERLASLTAPGGVLVVIGCARSSTPRDMAVDVVGVIQHQVLSRIRGYWQHSAPIQMEFPHTYSQVEQIASQALPGMTWRRLSLWRYAIIWRKPR